MNTRPYQACWVIHAREYRTLEHRLNDFSNFNLLLPDFAAILT